MYFLLFDQIVKVCVQCFQRALYVFAAVQEKSGDIIDKRILIGTWEALGGDDLYLSAVHNICGILKLEGSTPLMIGIPAGT